MWSHDQRGRREVRAPDLIPEGRGIKSRHYHLAGQLCLVDIFVSFNLSGIPVHRCKLHSYAHGPLNTTTTPFNMIDRALKVLILVKYAPYISIIPARI